MTLEENLGPSWYKVLGGEFDKPYMKAIASRIQPLRDKNLLRPAASDIFNAYRAAPPEKVKVVIVGQDPYPGNEAHGLSFSSKLPSIPPSLRIIFRELERSGMGVRTNPNLQDWADQGVLLLNSVLTTTYRIANAHKDWKWQQFTMATLLHLNTLEQPIVYMRWGKPAVALVDKALAAGGIEENFFSSTPRLVLSACHPQAQNYSGGTLMFVGCEHFSLANTFLKERAIKWV